MAEYFDNSQPSYSELRTTMRTPEHELLSGHSAYNSMSNNMDSSRTSSSTTSSNVTNGYIPPSENFYEVPFDRNEWLVPEPFSGRKRPPRQNEFLQLLLEKPHYSSYITWINKKDGLFTILLPTEVARLWEKVKHRQTSKEMDYQTFSRGLRAYYTNGIMIKTYKKYTFCFNQSMTPE